jgi:hypothetical protein
MLRYVIEGLTFTEIDRIARATPVANCSLTRFDGASGTLSLADYNDTAHLIDPVPAPRPGRSSSAGQDVPHGVQ